MEDHGREVKNTFGATTGVRPVTHPYDAPEPALPPKLEQVMTGIKEMVLHKPSDQREVRGTYADALRDFAVLLHYIAPGIPVVDEIRARWVS